jgi:hypothetical protein
MYSEETHRSACKLFQSSRMLQQINVKNVTDEGQQQTHRTHH